MELYKEIEKSFSKIEKLFSDEGLLEFSQTLPGDLSKFDMGLGTMVRLKFLRPKSVLYRKFVESGFDGDRYKMSAVILQLFHYSLNRV